MGKRSNFVKLDKDKYYTFDPKAGNALKPFFRGYRIKAIEPFAGAGDLTNQIDWADWVAKTDIEPSHESVSQRDAFDYKSSDFEGVDFVITNPPWTRNILHPSIEHFANLVPTWMLLDANWAWTAQAAKYIERYCTDIVTIGRLKWIPDTNMTGKDDCAWFCFTKDKDKEPTYFYPRQ